MWCIEDKHTSEQVNRKVRTAGHVATAAMMYRWYETWTTEEATARTVRVAAQMVSAGRTASTVANAATAARAAASMTPSVSAALTSSAPAAASAITNGLTVTGLTTAVGGAGVAAVGIMSAPVSLPVVTVVAGVGLAVTAVSALWDNMIDPTGGACVKTSLHLSAVVVAHAQLQDRAQSPFARGAGHGPREHGGESRRGAEAGARSTAGSTPGWSRGTQPTCSRHPRFHRHPPGALGYLSPLVEMSSRQLVAGHPAHLLTAAWNVGTAHGATSHFCFARGRVRGAGEEHLRGRREFPDRPRGNISPTACQRLSSAARSPAAPHLRNSGTRLPYKALTPQPYIACVHRSYLAIVSDVSC